MDTSKLSVSQRTPHLLTIKERIAGYKESMHQANLHVVKELNLSAPSSASSALSQLFASRNRPDAIFTANNASTIWVIAALREMGLQMGQDLGLVGFDDVDFFLHLITPSVTAVRQLASELGNVSTRLLLQKN